MKWFFKRHKTENAAQVVVTGWLIYRAVDLGMLSDWTKVMLCIAGVALCLVFFSYARHLREMLGYGREERG